jgi:hypothetical protein
LNFIRQPPQSCPQYRYVRLALSALPGLGRSTELAEPFTPPIERERVAACVGNCAYFSAITVHCSVAINAEVVKMALAGMAVAGFHCGLLNWV